MLYRLTGRWSSDLSTASATELLDIQEYRWNGEALALAGVGALRLLVPEPLLDAHPAHRTWCYLLAQGRWFAGGAINNAGPAVQWVRDQFYAGHPSGEGFARLFVEAGRAPAGAGPGAV